MFMQQQPQSESPVRSQLFGVKRIKKKEGNPAPAPRPKSWHNPGGVNSFNLHITDTHKHQDSIVPQHKPESRSVISVDEDKSTMYHRRVSDSFTQNQEKNLSLKKNAKSLSSLNSNIFDSEHRHSKPHYGMVKRVASQIDSMNLTGRPDYSGSGQDYVQMDNFTTGPIKPSTAYNPKFRSASLEIEPADVYPKKVVSKQINRDKAIAFMGTIPNKSDIQNGSSHQLHGQEYYIQKSQVYGTSHSQNNNWSSGKVQMPVRQFAIEVDPIDFQKQKLPRDSDMTYKRESNQDPVYIPHNVVEHVKMNPPPPPIRDVSSLAKPSLISDHAKSSSWPVHSGPNTQADNNATTRNNTITSDSLPPVKLTREQEMITPRQNTFSNEKQRNEQYNARPVIVSPKTKTTIKKKETYSSNSGLFTATLYQVQTDEPGNSDDFYAYEKSEQNEYSKPYDYNAYNVPSPPTRDIDVESVSPQPNTLSSTLSSENLVDHYRNHLEQALQREDNSPDRSYSQEEPKLFLSNKMEENTYPIMKRNSLQHSRQSFDNCRPEQISLHKYSTEISANEPERNKRCSGSLDEAVAGRTWKSPDDHKKEEEWKHLVETADAQYQKTNVNSKTIKEVSNPPVPEVSRVRSPISSPIFENNLVEQPSRGRSNSDVFLDDHPNTNFGNVTEDFTKRFAYRQQHETSNLNATAPAGESNFSSSDLRKMSYSSSSSILSQLQRDQMVAPSTDKQADYYSSTKDYHREDTSQYDHSRQIPLNSSKSKSSRQERHHHDKFHDQTNEDYSQQLKAMQQKVLQKTSYPQYPMQPPSPRHSDSSSSSNCSSRRSSHSQQFSGDSDGGQNKFRASEANLYKRNPTDEKGDRTHRFSDPRKYRKKPFDDIKVEHQHSKSDSERHNKPYNSMQGHKISDPSGAIPKSQRLSDPQASKLQAQDALLNFYKTKSIRTDSMSSLISPRSTSISGSSHQGSLSDQVTSPVGITHSRSSSMSSTRQSYNQSGQFSSSSSTSSLSPIPKPPSPNTAGKGSGVTIPTYIQRAFSYDVTKGRVSMGSYIQNNEDRASIRRTNSLLLQPPVKVKPLDQITNIQHGIDSTENLRNRPHQADSKSGFPFRVEEPSDWSGVHYQPQGNKQGILEKNETSHQTILEMEEEVHETQAKLSKSLSSPVFKFPNTDVLSPNIIHSTVRREEDSDGSTRSSDTPDIIAGTEQKDSRFRPDIDKSRFNTADSFILPSPPATPIDTDVPFEDLPPPPPEVLEDQSHISDTALPLPPRENAINQLNILGSECKPSTEKFVEQSNNKLQRSSSEIVVNSHRLNRSSEDGSDCKISPSITPSLSPTSDVSLSPSVAYECTTGVNLNKTLSPSNDFITHPPVDTNIDVNRKSTRTSPSDHRQTSLQRWKNRRTSKTDKHSEELKNTILSSCSNSELIRLLSTEVSAEPYIMEIFPDMSNGCNKNYGKKSPLKITDTTEDSQGSPERVPLSPISTLSPTSQYYVSTSKALLIKKASEEMEGNSEEINTHELNKKKEELINSISKKLEGLKLELQELEEDKKKNDELGDEITEVVKKVCERREIRKYNQYIEEQSKIIDLLLSLSGRLARANNALKAAEAEGDEEQKTSLQQLLTKLNRQYGDAKTLKDSVEKKSKTVSGFLKTNLNSEQYQDYEYFIETKSHLTWMSREFNDKIKLGEEQLQALRGSMLRSEKSEKVL
ncbi:protein Shroom2-like isoform X2 [Anneissia japonica]|uniref:protein Shroom2-like isoform X2 n=1 Tax=Anneissia japonica TaxID=1529436 RepID=UPI00142560BB|nr:protein Shroom2-like isoform X2 [Anneissia japonica]